MSDSDEFMFWRAEDSNLYLLGVETAQVRVGYIRPWPDAEGYEYRVIDLPGHLESTSEVLNEFEEGASIESVSIDGQMMGIVHDDVRLLVRLNSEHEPRWRRGFLSSYPDDPRETLLAFLTSPGPWTIGNIARERGRTT